MHKWRMMYVTKNDKEIKYNNNNNDSDENKNNSKTLN